jgi:hypothetical protein
LFDQEDYEKFDGNTEVVATIINFETGNDSITGRQPTDGPQRLPMACVPSFNRSLVG